MARKMKPDKESIQTGDGATDDLPFPDSDISPHLQRTLARKLEAGENDAIDRDLWDKIMRRSVESDEES